MIKIRKGDNLIYDKYGKYYDLIYSAKNYDGECESLISYFKKFSKDKIKSILDVGCGTGNHSIRFAESGYNVIGVDLSEVMINQAKRKVEGRNLPIKFFVQDMRKLSLKKKFDTVLCLFGTFGYCTRDEEILETLKRVGNHLEKDGLFIFDFFPLHAYVRRESHRSIHEVEKNKTYILRIIDTSLNLETNIVEFKIKCKVIKNGKLVDRFEEEHKIRIFTPPEIAHLLKETGFKPLGFFNVNWQAERPYSLESITLQTTNVACVAKI